MESQHAIPRCGVGSELSTVEKDIPGNSDAVATLRGLARNGNALAFAGSGASAGLYPMWGELIKRLADKCLSKGVATKATHKFWMSIKDKRPHQVVSGIKEALGGGAYNITLQDIFRPRQGEDGNRYTLIQGALVRIPFRGLVTTNYDPGLLEARASLRAGIASTGYTTWKDHDKVNEWHTGDIFGKETLPILYAHGIYERADSMVLGVEEYREAYSPGPFRRLFEYLWSHERLVFVGYGFTDLWLDFIADEVLTESGSRLAAPRHIAIVGLGPNQQYSEDMRRMYSDQYNADVCFYRIRASKHGEDHSELLCLLEELATLSPDYRGNAVAPSKALKSASPELWVHETTNDDRFVEHGDTVSRLDRWTEDPAVQVIAAVGLGGLGKTSLIGHWLKNRGGARDRCPDGLFYWSFYDNRDVPSFLATFRDFATKSLGLRIRTQAAVGAAEAIIDSASLVVVLDGLEVLQEGPETIAYGMLLEYRLRDFLDYACRAQHKSLVILTSRFPFADLNPYLGAGLRVLDLDSLTPVEGATLLSRCGVRGTEAERAIISEDLEGHPLALRVFAATLNTQKKGDPSRLLKTVLGRAQPSQSEPLERKLRHLLAFYRRHTPKQRIALMGIISLFRAPVSISTVRKLALGLPRTRTLFLGLSEERIESELNALRTERMVSGRHSGGSGNLYSCHPILRDFFRNALIGHEPSNAVAIANFMTGRPAEQAVKSISDIEPILDAIEVLLDAKDFGGADDLYSSRLDNGNLFMRLPAPHEGMQCAVGFVATKQRRKECEKHRPWGRLASYLNDAGIFGMLAGEPDEALVFLRDSIRAIRKIGDEPNLVISLVNYSEQLAHLGKLSDAEAAAREAFAIAKSIRNNISKAATALSFVLTMQGRLRESLATDRHAAFETGLVSVYKADLLLRIGDVAGAQRVATDNLAGCLKKHWQDDVARSKWILARAESEKRHYDRALDLVKQAEVVMRRGYMMQDLPWILICEAEVRRRRHSWTDSLANADEAIRIAAPRGLQLAHAQALAVRAEIRLSQAKEQKMRKRGEARKQVLDAQDDASAAVSLARQCGYPWAERDALLVLSGVHSELGHSQRSDELAQEAETITRRFDLLGDLLG